MPVIKKEKEEEPDHSSSNKNLTGHARGKPGRSGDVVARSREKTGGGHPLFWVASEVSGGNQETLRSNRDFGHARRPQERVG